MNQGRVHQISVSDGGVPKRSVPRAEVTKNGLVGDRQSDLAHHGGPDRAVSLFSLEVIERLRAEGHPVHPGTAGENLTLAGLDWPSVVPGCRLEYGGGVVLEIVSFCSPCSTIRDSFRDLSSKRIKQELFPGESRVYARVIVTGSLGVGETVRATDRS